MFCPQFRPLVGGAERQAEKLAFALATTGRRVHILTPRIDSDSPSYEEINGVVIERFPLLDLAKRWPMPGIALLNIPCILWQVMRAVRPHLVHADVLHTHIASLQTLGAVLAAHLSGVPAVCKAATADQRSDLGRLEKQGPSGKLISRMFRRTPICWVATTEAVTHALVSAGVRPNRIVQIPNGVEINGMSSIRTRPVRRFLYLGRLSSGIRRDVPTLIAAFVQLSQLWPDVELALVGGGDLLSETRALAERYMAAHRIYTPGFDRPEKWLEWADCFVLPSRVEGLSNALLEAMATGLPCIANDIPPNREVLADGTVGGLVPVGDESRLFHEMNRMVNDDAHAVSMGNAARKRVEEYYEINAVAARYLRLYDKLINKK
jgi:glycosyltransferase involved in cell wall biosynthesis